MSYRVSLAAIALVVGIAGATLCAHPFTIKGTVVDSSLTLANLILEHAKVAIVPGEAFGAPGYARLSYALGDDDLVEGVSRINALLREG